MRKILHGDRILAFDARASRTSLPGLVLGTALFAASVAPSLIPKPPLLLGVLAGGSFGLGYLLGMILTGLWAWLGLPRPAWSRTLNRAILATCLAILLVFLWRSIGWQNEVRALMEMPPAPQWQFIVTGGVALLVFLLLYGLGIGVRALFRQIYRQLQRFLPHRVALLLGACLVVLLTWLVANGILFRVGLDIADASFRRLDAMIEPDVPAPADPLREGSAASLIRWDEIGREGRHYLGSGPSQADIARVVGPAEQPIRVYAGLNSAPDPDARARLALAELKRVGGFERPVLVVIAPTGTGWVDEAAIDSLEYLHRGKVASVAAQYSYLSSWLSLLLEPDHGVEGARALFREVYGYWKTLPKDKRPRLYLFGLSLGALSSERSLDLFDMIEDPIQGALWSGPPFPCPLWRAATAERKPGSPAWLPRFGDDSVVRFTNQDNHLAMPGARWGPMRIVYLQYGSDPITFFEPAMVYRRPRWMSGQRAPDVLPTFRWLPVVTFLQTGMDITLSGGTPPGYGHVYAAEHYLDGWVAVTQPEGWSEADLARLREALRARQRHD